MKKIICIVDRVDETVYKVQTSMKIAGYDVKILSLHREDETRDYIWTPFTLSSYIRLEDQSSTPLFFNNLPVPKFWEIATDGYSGSIWDKGVQKGRIAFRENSRDVSFVMLQDPVTKGDIQEYYNIYGWCYRQDVIEDGKVVLQTFFNDMGEETVLYYPLQDKVVQMGKTTSPSIFSHYDDFTEAMIRSAIEEASLAILLDPALLEKIPEALTSKIVLWKTKQDTNSLSERATKIIVGEKFPALQVQAHQQVVRLDYLYDLEPTTVRPEVFILTHTEMLLQIRECIEGLPEFHFHIAAITEMGGQLLALQNYPNVSLYPGADREKIMSLFQRCSIYLDINYDIELFDACETAIIHQQLLLSFEDTCHRRDLILPENVYHADQVQEMVDKIHNLLADEDRFQEIIQKQLSELSVTTKEDYQQIFETWMKES